MTGFVFVSFSKACCTVFSFKDGEHT